MCMPYYSGLGGAASGTIGQVKAAEANRRIAEAQAEYVARAADYEASRAAAGLWPYRRKKHDDPSKPIPINMALVPISEVYTPLTKWQKIRPWVHLGAILTLILVGLILFANGGIQRF